MKLPCGAAVLMLCLVLGACNDTSRHGSSAKAGTADDANALPAPEAQSGSITGMPDALPAPGTVAAATPPALELPAAEDTDADVASADDSSEDDASNDDAPAAAESNEPGGDAAVRVIRDYYAAINRRDYAAAYALWRGQGQASGKSAAQFARGFLDTRGVSIEIGAAGAIDAGAGQRYIEVPVSLIASHADGSEHRYAGHYVLQRSVVGGASDTQRSWRIQSAALSETP